MKVGDWLADPLKREWQIVYKHPMKDEFLLMDTAGFHLWMPFFYLFSRWKLT